MGDDLGCAQPAQAGTALGVLAVGEAVQEARRVEVPGTGGVGHAIDRVGRDMDRPRRGAHHRARRAPGERGQDPGLLDGTQGVVEAGRAEQQGDLVLVGEQDVDVTVEQLEELALVALHAERVGDAQGHEGVRRVGHLDGTAHGGYGRTQVPQIALEVDHLGPGDEGLVEVLRSQGRRHAQVGRHGPFPVLGDIDQASSRGPVVGGVTAGGLDAEVRPEHDAGGGDVVQEDLSELVGGHLADEPHPASERGHPRRGVRRRATRDPAGVAHALVEGGRPGQVHEGHRPLDQVGPAQVLVAGIGEDVDQGGADGDDIEGLSTRLGAGMGVVHSPASYSETPALGTKAASRPG